MISAYKFMSFFRTMNVPTLIQLIGHLEKYPSCVYLRNHLFCELPLFHADVCLCMFLVTDIVFFWEQQGAPVEKPKGPLEALRPKLQVLALFWVPLPLLRGRLSVFCLFLFFSLLIYFNFCSCSSLT